MFNPFRNFSYHSIQMKIFTAFALVTLLAVVAVTSIWYINTSNKLEEKTAHSIRDNIQYANDNLEILIRDIDNINLVITINRLNVLNVLTSQFDSPNYDWFLEVKKIKDFLAALFKYKQSVIQGIAVIGLDGEMYTAGQPLLGRDILAQPWSAAVLKAAGNKVIVKRDEPGTGSAIDAAEKSVLTIGRAIMDNGKPLGIAIVDMKYEIVSSFFALQDLAENSTIIVSDGQGHTIYRSTPPSGPDLPVAQIVRTPPARSNSSEFAEFGGHKYLVYRYHSEYTGWTTAGMVPRKALLKDFIVTRNQTMTVVALILLLVFLVSLGVSGQITRNLKQLRDTIRSIEDGDLSATPAIRSRDEVGQLSESFTRMMGRIQALVREITLKEKQKRLTEIKALQAQISPHFLYNTLNIIKYLATLQNIKNIAEVTTSLIDLLRYAIGHDEQFVTIKEELAHIERYVTIQKYKYSDKFSVIYQVEEAVLNCKTLRVILQPVVENALIHGIDSLPEEGLISIKVYREADVIKFVVTDNGVGIPQEKIAAIFSRPSNEHRSRFSGIGLQNVAERIKLFFGNDYGLKLFSQPGMCTTVEISIPALDEGKQDAV